MALHGEIKVNGATIGAWSARRTEQLRGTDDAHTYECVVEVLGHAAPLGYARHVEHALRYLHPNGVLTAILPATARYDHGLLSGSWEDLPVGAFSESGTNVNTCILTLRRPADPG